MCEAWPHAELACQHAKERSSGVVEGMQMVVKEVGVVEVERKETWS